MLIAEIGNNHFGNYDDFRELIKVAKNCGADIVKSQAGVKHGSMPPSFYVECDLGLDLYIEAIYWARYVAKIDLFYSVFHQDYYPLFTHQNFFKLSANQSEENNVLNFDSDQCIISTREPKNIPLMQRASLLYATDYGENYPDFEQITLLDEKVEHGEVGFSDHCIGVENSIKAVQEFDAKIIEKHFTIERNMKYKDQIFRDTVHAAVPYQLDKLSREIK